MRGGREPVGLTALTVEADGTWEARLVRFEGGALSRLSRAAWEQWLDFAVAFSHSREGGVMVIVHYER